MKKEYKEPSIVVLRIFTQQVIAVSLVEEGATGDALSRGGYWDDEEDYDY